jgi:hypothetical protein
MGGNWQEAIAMGFTPMHIRNDRVKSGPNVLVDVPFKLDWDMMERTMGITIDEAVFELDFSTADFAVFGETVRSLVRRGFAPVHVRKMNEPAGNYELSLEADKADVTFLFGREHVTSHSTQATPGRFLTHHGSTEVGGANQPNYSGQSNQSNPSNADIVNLQEKPSQPSQASIDYVANCNVPARGPTKLFVADTASNQPKPRRKGFKANMLM